MAHFYKVNSFVIAALPNSRPLPTLKWKERGKEAADVDVDLEQKTWC